MIPYTYQVIQSSPKGMVLRYTSPGREPVSIGTHAPTPGESLDAIAMQYSPVPMWLAQDAERVVVPVGTTGSYTPPAPPAVTLESVKAQKLADLAAWRYDKEVGGISIAGSRIKTDRESQATITGAFISLSQGLATSIDWKAEGGVWVQLTLAQIAPIAQAVVAHVQACFSAERLIAEEIQAATTIEAVQAIAFPDEVLSGAA